MNLPYRLMPAILRPSSRSAMCWGSPPRRMRRQRNSADTIRLPTRCAIDRVTVSTSGSSGTFRNLEENLVPLQLHLIGGDTLGGIILVLPGAAVEFPKVKRADHAPFVDL